MENHVLKKITENNELIYYNSKTNGYQFKPHHENRLKISEVMLIKPSLIDKVLTSNIKDKYRKLVMTVLSLIRANDTDEGDCIIALGEIERLKQIILTKYYSLIKVEKSEMFLEKLDSLEQTLRNKINELIINKEYQTEKIIEEEKHKGR